MYLSFKIEIKNVILRALNKTKKLLTSDIKLIYNSDPNQRFFFMNIYKDYLKQIKERKLLGLHPQPIDDSILLIKIIEQIKDLENEYREDSLNFFIYNVLPVLE